MANSLNKITTKSILDATVATADIADDAVTADKLANAINTDIAAKAVLTGSTNNTITTVTGANAIQGEANLTFDGDHVTQTIDASGEGFNQTAAGNHYIENLASANRSSADGVIWRQTADWNGKTVAQVKMAAGSDTTNKDDGYITFWTSAANDNAERVRIDTSGRILAGTTSVGWDGADDLTVNNSGNAGITIRSGDDDAGTLAFADGTSGADGYRGFVQYNQGTEYMTIGTDGTQRLRVDSDGLKFGSDSAAANALSDYEEGTWDPTFQTSDSNFSGGYSAQHGNYVKIGKLVYIFGRVSWSSTGGTGNLQIANVPFAMEHGSDYDDQINIGYRTNIGYPRLHTSLSNTSDRINLHAVDGSSPFDSFSVVVGALQSTGHIYFAGCYRAD